VALFALIGLVVDGGTAIATQSAATDVAQQAARAGAAQLSVSALRAGQVALDAPGAVAAAEAYLSAAGFSGSASVSGSSVTVNIQDAAPTSILGILGIGSINVTATGIATDVHGIVTAD
jgi:Flp pilus assembly protein TadG